MASSLEGNKLLAAILTGGILVFGAGVVSTVIYSPHQLEENAFPIAVESGGEDGGGDVEAEPLPVLLASADVGAGEKVAKKCVSCHVFEEGGENKIGPVLYNVVNREIASVPGFEYSSALADMDTVWDYAALDGFLHAPKDWAPGTKMSFAGLGKPTDRADLLVYLRSLSAEPAPLPEAGDEQDAEAEESAATEAGDAETAEAEEAVEDVVAEGGSEPTGEAAEAADVAEAEADVAPVEGEGGATAEEVEVADGAEAAADEEANTAPAAEAAGGGFAALVAAADPEAGAKQARKCKACHDLEEGGKNKIGPALWGVVGRDIGSVDGFNYSDAFANHGDAWTYENLNAYLTNPKEWVPGNKMSFAGVKKEEDRAALIAYLRTLSASPAPLP